MAVRVGASSLHAMADAPALLFSLDAVNQPIYERMYSQLLFVEEADEALRDVPRFKDFLAAVEQEILSHGLEDCVGLKLVYRRVELKRGQVALERFVQYQGKPSFVTEACDVAKARKMKAAPCAWIPGRDGAVPSFFEFSTDTAVKAALVRIQNAPDFIPKISAILCQYQLLGLIAISILRRESLVAGKHQVYREIIEQDTEYSVVQLAAIRADTEEIKQAWVFRREGAVEGLADWVCARPGSRVSYTSLDEIPSYKAYAERSLVDSEASAVSEAPIGERFCCCQ